MVAHTPTHQLSPLAAAPHGRKRRKKMYLDNCSPRASPAATGALSEVQIGGPRTCCSARERLRNDVPSCFIHSTTGLQWWKGWSGEFLSPVRCSLSGESRAALEESWT